VANKLVKLCCLVLYYGIARHLPEHSDPRGALWKKFRAATVRPLLRHAGKEIIINAGVHFGNGSNLSMGDYSSLGLNARVIGEVHMGNHVGSAQEVFLCAYNREFKGLDKPMMFQGKRPDQPIIIEDDVILLARCIILAGVRIHTGAAIGAAAVVTRDVPPYAIVVGNPARVVGFRAAPPADMDFSRMTPIDCPIPREGA
jgi:maltose O-acetyltransferase